MKSFSPEKKATKFVDGRILWMTVKTEEKVNSKLAGNLISQICTDSEKDWQQIFQLLIFIDGYFGNAYSNLFEHSSSNSLTFIL